MDLKFTISLTRGLFSVAYGADYRYWVDRLSIPHGQPVNDIAVTFTTALDEVIAGQDFWGEICKLLGPHVSRDGHPSSPVGDELYVHGLPLDAQYLLQSASLFIQRQIGRLYGHGVIEVA